MNRYEQIPSEIKCIYERLDPLLPAMPLTDASSALFVLMIFHATWFLTKEKNITARKSRWLTSMRLTDLPVWPSVRRLPGREGNGQETAGAIPRRVLSLSLAARILLQQISQVWKPRRLNMKTVPLVMKPVLHRDVAGGPAAKSPRPDSRGPESEAKVRELDPTSHR